MFNFGAFIHDDAEASLGCYRLGFFAHNANLQPQIFGAYGNGLFCNGRAIIRPPKHIHHINSVGDIVEIGINLFAQQVLPRNAGIDRDDAIALFLQIFHHKIRRPVPIGACPHHGDGFGLCENIGNLEIVIHGAGLLMLRRGS